MDIIGPQSSDATRRMVDFARRNRLPATLAGHEPRGERRGDRADRAGSVTTSCRWCGCPAAPSCAIRRPARCRGRSASGSSSRRARRSTCSSSAAARPGSARPSTAPPRGSTRSSSRAAALGGQAGTSRRIENYLGFPAGISGSELTGQGDHAGAEVRRPHRHALPRARARAGRRPPPRPARGRPRGAAPAPSSSRRAPTTAGCPSPTSTPTRGSASSTRPARRRRSGAAPRASASSAAATPPPRRRSGSRAAARS